MSRNTAVMPRLPRGDLLSYTSSALYAKFEAWGIRVRAPDEVPLWAIYVYWRVPHASEEAVMRKAAELTDDEVLSLLTLAQLDGVDGHEVIRVFYFGDTVTCERGHVRDVRTASWHWCQSCPRCAHDR